MFSLWIFDLVQTQGYLIMRPNHDDGLNMFIRIAEILWIILY